MGRGLARIATALAGGLVAAALVVSACGDPRAAGEGEESTGDPSSTTSTAAGPASEEAVAAAEELCPIMWTWVTDVGRAFNEAAEAVGDIADIDRRRARWEEAFVEIERLDAALLVDLGPLADDPVLAPLVAEIVRDLPLAQEELDGIRRLFVDRPEVDEQRHQVRTSQIIVRIEKVIDLPKPDLRPLDTDGTLLPAFRRVVACQHAIRDVDDGTTTYNG